MYNEFTYEEFSKIFDQVLKENPIPKLPIGLENLINQSNIEIMPGVLWSDFERAIKPLTT